MFASLGSRLVLTVLATAITAYVIFVGLTVMRLDRSLEQQAFQIGRLSEEKLGRQLDGEAKLARARLQVMAANIARRLDAIAQRADVTRAVSTSNVVSISEILGRAAQNADIDGIIVIDAQLRVLGAHSGQIDLLNVNRHLQHSKLGSSLRAILSENDRQKPRHFESVLSLDENLAAAFGARGSAPLAMVSAVPLFDEFGDVFAALIGHRILKPVEQTLVEFTKLEGNALIVQAEGQPISAAGLQGAIPFVEPATKALMRRVSDRNHLSRCIELFRDYELCALTSYAELNALRDEMVRIGTGEGRSLTHWLFLVSGLSLVAFAVITFLASQKIVQPLASIAAAVRAVARGDWKSEVTGTDRKDEIGDIARAVIVLQQSLEERDRLKVDVANAEIVNQRRDALEESIRKFDRDMRSVLLNVSDRVDHIEDTARDLARFSAIAEGEAAEVSFLTDHSFEHVRTLGEVTGRLDIALQQMLGQGDPVVSDAMASAMENMADANTKALKVVLDTAKTTPDPVLLDEFRKLASTLSVALDDNRETVAELDKQARKSSPDPVRIEALLEKLSEQTLRMMVSIRIHEHFAKDISDNVALAAIGTSNIAASVKRLRGTVEETRGSSLQVVTKAGEMVEEAIRLNVTVKSFLREVAVR